MSKIFSGVPYTLGNKRVVDTITCVHKTYDVFNDGSVHELQGNTWASAEEVIAAEIHNPDCHAMEKRLRDAVKQITGKN